MVELAVVIAFPMTVPELLNKLNIPPLVLRRILKATNDLLIFSLVMTRVPVLLIEVVLPTTLPPTTKIASLNQPLLPMGLVGTLLMGVLLVGVALPPLVPLVGRPPCPFPFRVVRCPLPLLPR